MEQMPIFDINKICRVCLEEGMLVSIYSTEYAISPLDMIVVCTNVKVYFYKFQGFEQQLYDSFVLF